jgi:hypothetical protein
MNTQEVFPFAERADDSQKNAIVINNDQDNQSDFLSLAWVLRARSKDEAVQPHLCGLYSDGQGRFMATDGHRLHVAGIPSFTERIPEGIWVYVHADKKNISLKEAPDGTPLFPNITGLLDMSEQHKKRGMILFMEDESSAVWQYWDFVGVKCNIDYLLDILKGPDAFDVFSSLEANTPIFFISAERNGNAKKAVLMPLKELTANNFPDEKKDKPKADKVYRMGAQNP